jgi:hypothetical protein
MSGGAAAVAAQPGPQEVLPHFAMLGRVQACERYGNGHINDTYAVRVDQAGTPVRWILQRLNGRVFPQPAQVMANVASVIAHLQAGPQAEDARCQLSLLPGRDGRPWVVDAAGAHWRCYPFIEGSRTIERVGNPTHAHAAGRTFAAFINRLATYTGPRLHEVIPGFHDTPRRLAHLRDAAQADTAGRLAGVRDEVDWALGQARLAGSLIASRETGGIPERITHNDTKINNVLFDAERDCGLCVIDLDTLMPGLSLFDFGDLVRTATATAAEDETDLARIDSDPALYAALEQGWLDELAATLTPAERSLLPVAGAVISFECGVRFLTDHLLGDHYFRIARPGHNAVRARNQFAMAQAVLRRQGGG